MFEKVRKGLSASLEREKYSLFKLKTNWSYI